MLLFGFSRECNPKWYDCQVKTGKRGWTKVIHFKHTTSTDNNLLPCSFAQLSRLITDNGGNVVDLAEPKLTHIVVDKRDVSRRLELMKRTSKSVTFTPNLSHRVDKEQQGPSDVIWLYLDTFKHA